MYSLAKIIDIMLWRGGWVDKKNGELLKDFVDLENSSTGYITRNKNWDIVDVDFRTGDYLRIPSTGGGLSSMHFIKKNNIGSELLKKYGILEHAKHEYSLFSDNGYKSCISEDELFFGVQVSGISDDLEIELPDISEYGMDMVMRWCEENNIDVLDDYVPSCASI